MSVLLQQKSHNGNLFWPGNPNGDAAGDIKDGEEEAEEDADGAGIIDGKFWVWFTLKWVLSEPLV